MQKNTHTNRDTRVTSAFYLIPRASLNVVSRSSESESRSSSTLLHVKKGGVRLEAVISSKSVADVSVRSPAESSKDPNAVLKDIVGETPAVEVSGEA